MLLDYEILRTLFSGFTLLSVCIAYVALKENIAKANQDRDTAHDKEILGQASTSLEWSYNSLTQGNQGTPVPDRLNWLTAARHIQRYYKLKAMLKTDTYKLLNEENEEHWRHAFFKLLDDRAMAKSDYFTNNRPYEWPENIELTSAMIVSEFSQWNNDTEDPVDEASREYLIDHGAFNGTFGKGLQSYYIKIKQQQKNPPA